MERSTSIQIVDSRRVPGPEGRERNRLSVLSRWKILDNLRRSTVEIAQLALLIAGWTLLPGSPVRWTLLALGALAAPWIVASPTFITYELSGPGLQIVLVC